MEHEKRVALEKKRQEREYFMKMFAENEKN